MAGRLRDVGIALLCAGAVLWTAGPAAAQEPAADAWDLERAWTEMERLQAEIAVLRGLAEAQAALLAFNRARAGSGGGPAVLDARLCEEPALREWCRALPASFGRQAGSAAAGAGVEDGQR